MSQNIPKNNNKFQYVLVVLGIAILYYGAARLGLFLAFEKTNASPVWPPSGFAFAVILLLGYRIWPGILLGAFIANMAVFLDNQAGNIEFLVVVSLAIAIGNTLEAVCGKLLLDFVVKSRTLLEHTLDVFIFATVALIMCTVSCTVGATSLCVSNIVPWSLYSTVWFTWWLGDVTGILALTPLILICKQSHCIHWSTAKVVEAISLFISLLAAGLLVFGGQFSTQIIQSLSYLFILFLLWTSFRFSQRETCIAVVVTSFFAIVGTLNDKGPFIGGSLNESLLLLQAFICIIALTAIALSTTVAERKRYEEHLKTSRDNLKHHAEELARSNKELEQYAYVASHDLQEPLRKVVSYTQLLEKRYQDQLDERANKYIYYIVDGASRMQILIQDLLGYSRLHRKSPSFALVNTSEVLKQVMEDIELILQETKVIITHDKLPTIEADSTQIKQLLQNLIENAIKFRSENSPKIHVFTRQEKNSWVLAVKDNGIGIESQFFERIFVIFQRLHTRSEYPGTGIGLAICKKIVEQHKGRIWIESELEKGTTVFFSIPRKQHERKTN